MYMSYYFYTINNKVTFHTAYLSEIAKNQPGGRISYNVYLLANEDYWLSRSKGVLGSLLSNKEISQFDIDKINTKSVIENNSPRLISFYLDYPQGKSKSLTPIGLRRGNNSKKDAWYYFTLLGYVDHTGIPIVLIITQVLLAITCARVYKRNTILLVLYSFSFIFLILFCCVF